MRELKFRAWNRQDNEYITGNRIRVDGDGLLYIDRITVKTAFVHHTRKNPWFIVEQYTGLKDKNGTEIYEGDIIRAPEYIGRIFYDEEYAYFKLKTSRSDHCFIALMQQLEIEMDDLEVVGNIHENPELLEEKHEDL